MHSLETIIHFRFFIGKLTFSMAGVIREGSAGLASDGLLINHNNTYSTSVLFGIAQKTEGKHANYHAKYQKMTYATALTLT